MKGGSRKDVHEDSFRIASVRWTDPASRDDTIGFRCAWDAPREAPAKE